MVDCNQVSAAWWRENRATRCSCLTGLLPASHQWLDPLSLQLCPLLLSPEVLGTLVERSGGQVDTVPDPGLSQSLQQHVCAGGGSPQLSSGRPLEHQTKGSQLRRFCALQRSVHMLTVFARVHDCFFSISLCFCMSSS